MKKKTFEPEKYGMVLCPCCNGVGYIQNPERQCCPKCGGFGFVKKESEEDMNTSAIIGKGDNYYEGRGHL
jgi:DnaJ-class molecular chaperone